jgi:hypothetical protein
MKEKPRRRVTVTSSLKFKFISRDQLGNTVVVRGEALLRPYPPLSAAGFCTNIF